MHVAYCIYLLLVIFITKWPSVIIDTLLLDLFNIKTGLYFVWLFVYVVLLLLLLLT